MGQLDKTFPTLDCSMCILAPKMVDCSKHENINLLTYSEVKEVDGYIGNFDVTVERKANLAFANFSDRQTTSGAGTWRIKSFITNGVASGVCLNLGNITRISCIDLEPAGTQIKIYGQRAY